MRRCSQRAHIHKAVLVGALGRQPLLLRVHALHFYSSLLLLLSLLNRK
jgi:hypothetical protein